MEFISSQNMVKLHPQNVLNESIAIGIHGWYFLYITLYSVGEEVNTSWNIMKTNPIVSCSWTRANFISWGHFSSFIKINVVAFGHNSYMKFFQSMGVSAFTIIQPMDIGWWRSCLSINQFHTSSTSSMWMRMDDDSPFDGLTSQMLS